MGCIGSHLAQLSHVHRNRQNIFSVLNVDEMGRNLQTGKLEVTETDLILYVHGKSALTWPLRSLRRYGYDEDLFSFESGRRCPSGPGIYAFKCHRAQSLFNLLQAKIQGNPTSLPTPITPTPLNSAGLSPTFDYVNISENQNNRGNSMTTTLIDQEGNDISHSAMNNTSTLISQDNNHPLYMNVESHNLPCCNLVNVNSNSLSQQPTNIITNNSDIKIPSHLNNYANTCTTTTNSGRSSFFADCPTSSINNSAMTTITPSAAASHINPNPFAVTVSNTCNSVYYSNVDCSLIQTTTSASSSTTTTGGTTTMASTTSFINNGNVSAEVNYAELDLETDSKMTTTSSSSMSSTTVTSYNSTTTKVTNPKKLRLNTLGGSLSDDSRFRSKIKSQFDHHNDNEHHHDSIFSSVVDSSVANAVNNSNSSGSTSCSNNNANNLPSVSSTERPGAGYATIDFDRTAALSVVTRTRVKLNCNSEDSEVSMRKTRHNSTAL